MKRPREADSVGALPALRKAEALVAAGCQQPVVGWDPVGGRAVRVLRGVPTTAAWAALYAAEADLDGGSRALVLHRHV